MALRIVKHTMQHAGGSQRKQCSGVRHKLHSESGASILLALAVVMVCAMVASVVIISAAANAGKGVSAQRGNTAYFTVSSAAQLLADDMASEVPLAEVSTDVKSYACQQEHPSYAHSDAGLVSQRGLTFTSTTGASTPFIKMVEEGLYAIDPTNEASIFERDFTIQAPELDDVSAHLTMDYEYNITVELQTVNDEGFGYGITLFFGAIRTEQPETTTTEKTDSHMDGWEYNEDSLSVPWREPTILNLTTGNYEPASNEFGHSAEQLYDVTTTTTTTSLSWGEGVMSKGVAHE